MRLFHEKLKITPIDHSKTFGSNFMIMDSSIVANCNIGRIHKRYILVFSNFINIIKSNAFVVAILMLN